MDLTADNPFTDGDRQAAFFNENCAKCRKHTKEYATLDEIGCNLERSYFLCALGVPIPVRHAKAMERGVCRRRKDLLISKI